MANRLLHLLQSCSRYRRRSITRSSLLPLLLLLLLLLVMLLIQRHAGTDTKRQVAGMLRTIKEQRNIVYIKVFKTASQTLVAMLRRFGASRRLHFALPLPKKIYLGWPLPLSRDFIVLEPHVVRPNLLVDHCVYNRTFLQKLMQQPCAFITSLRHPFAQLQSLFVYYNLAGITGINKHHSPFREYMQNITTMEAQYMSPSNSRERYCVPDNFSMTKNSMSAVLGYKEGQPADEFVQRILSEFDLILIADHFLHSLILLRRQMSWTFKDLLFEPINAGSYRRLLPAEAPDLFQIHRSWSPVDYQLFALANSTFWRRVAAEGDSFFDELQEFQRVLAEVRRQCRRDGSATVRVSGSWSPDVQLSAEECRGIRQEGVELLQAISEAAATRSQRRMLPQLKFC